jgi:putative transposase
VQRAFRCRVYPTPEQEALLRRTFGCVRYVWNWALDTRTGAYQQRKERVGYVALSAKLTALKAEPGHEWLGEVSSVPLQQTLRHQQRALTNFWEKRARYPRFKAKRRGRQSAEFTRSAFRWDGADLWLAKCAEPLPVRWSRPLPDGAEPSTVSVSLDPAGRWHVSILVDDPSVRVLPPVDAEVGIDAGITSLVTLSTGEKVTNPGHERADRRRLATAQRALARKKKGSANRAKAKLRVARVHARIADRRRDHLHKLTTRLVRENQTVVIEDLSVRNMLRNHSVARAVCDAAWSDLRGMLEYKCAWYGRRLTVVDRWYPSSKQCSACGHLLGVLPLRVRDWTCPACGAVHDRDVNAARNVLAAGRAVTACGDGVRPSRRESVTHLSQPPFGDQKQETSPVRVGIPRR